LAAGELVGSASCVTLTDFSFLGADSGFFSGIGIIKSKLCSAKEVSNMGRIKACKGLGKFFRV
jgi:hypothetical protein